MNWGDRRRSGERIIGLWRSYGASWRFMLLRDAMHIFGVDRSALELPVTFLYPDNFESPT